MYQYTTPIHTFTLEIDISTLSKCNIIYAQGDRILFKKTLDDVPETTGKTMSVTLSQIETGKFDPRFPAQIQLHAETVNGSVMASDVYTIEVKKLLEKEI